MIIAVYCDFYRQFIVLFGYYFAMLLQVVSTVFTFILLMSGTFYVKNREYALLTGPVSSLNTSSHYHLCCNYECISKSLIASS